MTARTAGFSFGLPRARNVCKRGATRARLRALRFHIEPRFTHVSASPVSVTRRCLLWDGLPDRGFTHPKGPCMSKLAQLRRSAFSHQNGLCHYCEHPMWEADPKAFARRSRLTLAQARHHRSTAEHLVARCDGGRDVASNVVAACWICNSRRHKGRSANAPDPSIYKIAVRRRCAKGKWLPWVGSDAGQPMARTTAAIISSA